MRHSWFCWLGNSPRREIFLLGLEWGGGRGWGGAEEGIYTETGKLTARHWGAMSLKAIKASLDILHFILQKKEEGKSAKERGRKFLFIAWPDLIPILRPKVRQGDFSITTWSNYWLADPNPSPSLLFLCLFPNRSGHVSKYWSMGHM